MATFGAILCAQYRFFGAHIGVFDGFACGPRYIDGKLRYFWRRGFEKGASGPIKFITYRRHPCTTLKNSKLLRKERPSDGPRGFPGSRLDPLAGQPGSHRVGGQLTPLHPYVRGSISEISLCVNTKLSFYSQFIPSMGIVITLNPISLFCVACCECIFDRLSMFTPISCSYSVGAAPLPRRSRRWWR